MDAPALRIRDLRKSFDEVKALDGVSFEVPRGSVYGLLGPNGAGKTTLFSVVAGFLHEDGGSVEALGIHWRRRSELRGRLSILPQDALFQRNVPILDQLVFFLLLADRNREQAEEEVRRTLETVGLGEHARRRVHALSHGMIKRLGLAQAFLGEPEVILLDEPTAGLDPQNARQIRDLIVSLRGRATVVVSSHNLAEIEELCDRVAILDEGNLVAEGAVEDIVRARRLNLALSRALEPAELGRLRAVAGVESVEPVGRERYAVTFAEGPDMAGTDAISREVLRALLDLEVTPRHLSEGTSLEEVFLKLTGGEVAGTPPPLAPPPPAVG